VNKLIAKAEVLLEALPYMQRFAGRTIVIKYGGSAMLDERLKLGFAQDVVLLNSLGLHPVIVHGGGPQIGKTLARLGIETRFVRGLRVTDEATMEVVEMVLGGRINKAIVTNIEQHGGTAVGISGKDGDLIKASKMKVRAKGDDGKTALLDIGLVGKVDEVRPQIVERLRESNFIPVIAPIGADARGNTYNINADTAASKIAQALGAEKLILLTDVKGILDKSGVLQPFLSIRSAKSQVRGGSIADGMVPKVECAIEALQNGVKQVHIIDGRVSHAVLLEIFTRKGVGTEVVQSERRPRARRPAAGAPVGKAGAA
jgi:acetylglutamate kinase